VSGRLIAPVSPMSVNSKFGGGSDTPTRDHLLAISQVNLLTATSKRAKDRLHSLARCPLASISCVEGQDEIFESKRIAGIQNGYLKVLDVK
jgi:hypothetical protein